MISIDFTCFTFVYILLRAIKKYRKEVAQYSENNLQDVQNNQQSAVSLREWYTDRAWIQLVEKEK